MVAFLGTQGCGDPVAIMDFENGLTFPALLSLNIEVGRLSLITEKRSVNAMCVSLASLFDKEVLSKYNTEINKALDETDILGGAGLSAPTQKARTPPKSDSEKSRQAIQSVQQMNKLNILLMGGG